MNCFLITTYNRQASCQRLVDSLQGLGEIIVAHDGTDYSISGALNLNPRQHLGKVGYWKLVNMLWKNRPQAKYYFMIPDDFIIDVTQVTKAIDIWERIQDPQKICLNLYMDRLGQSCWTRVMPIDKGNVWQTGWVDMCFLCEDKFFAVLGNLPPLHRVNGHIRGSSGVGAYISRKLNRQGFHFYQVKESLITIQDEHYHSMMHQ